MAREGGAEDLHLWRGEDHLLLRREMSNGEVVYVGYINGVEEVITPARGTTMRRLLLAMPRSQAGQES